jgi:sortase A
MTRRARALLRFLGWLMLVVGVLLIAWGFVVWKWGDPVTGLYTKWEQRKLADEYEQIVERYVPPKAVAAPAKPTVSPAELRRRMHTAAVAFHKSSEDGQAIGRIKVKRLGLNMVLLNGTDASTLKRGPGRDERTFMPGEGELVYIAGHRTTYGAPFAHIDRMRAGDDVEIDMPYGRFTYRVTRWVIVPADDLARLKTEGREEIALQACHPRFSASQRYIVYAVPKGVSPGTSS